MRAFSRVLIFALATSSAVAQSTAPFNRYLGLAEAGKNDARVTAFAHACVDSEIKPQKKFFYTQQNAWLPVTDLHFAFSGYVTGDANTAEVWTYAGVPRVVYVWEVDLEYQRDSLYCLDKAGDVLRAVSRFFPSQSGEPREHWVFVRTTRATRQVNVWDSTGVYEDEHGKRIANPDLSSEDKDFIKGERVVHYWNDFDFAGLLNKAPASQKENKP